MRSIVSVLSLLLATNCSTMRQKQTLDALVIDGGLIYGASTPQSIVTVAERISFIGSADEAARRAPAAQHIDASGMTILPGLVDAHAHLPGLGEFFDNVNLRDTSGIDEVKQRIVKHAGTLPKGDWLKGRGWDQNNWAVKQFPTAADLDDVIADRPVWLSRVDGHVSWANTKAMELAGITAATPDPEGGRIVRDGNGNPTGIFIDNAEALVESEIPPYSRERLRAQLRVAMTEAAKNGLTEVHDAGLNVNQLAALRDLADTGEMPIRVYVMLSDDAALLASWFASGPLINHKERLTVRAVKLYADGALGSRGAALLAPYSDDPGNSGLMVTPAEHIVDVARRARAAGFQVNTHAIGDRAVRTALESYEKAGVTADDRNRIEHFQVAHPDDIRKAARLGVIASMQPTHATSDMYWAEKRVGSDRIKGAYAWRSVLTARGRLAFGSDFPVEAVNPFLGIHAAVTRQDSKRWPAGGWQPQERLTLDEAIRGFTEGAAYAAFVERERGTIAVGKMADFTIIEGALDPAALDRTKVRYTIVGGKIAYE